MKQNGSFWMVCFTSAAQGFGLEAIVFTLVDLGFISLGCFRLVRIYNLFYGEVNSKFTINMLSCRSFEIGINSMIL